ncbi:hypothetical protein SLOPH_751 [Spraguea lophii 42_110]|uniref:Uncharacterized protein n=1 Tax=Spraguea lophii (strain 42_110) TaxID=1358809 RepID=S7XP45_SPRLO|nr:hypothetical protein SLOPH_751 [Spraguea lophii 42_110]
MLILNSLLQYFKMGIYIQPCLAGIYTIPLEQRNVVILNNKGKLIPEAYLSYNNGKQMFMLKHTGLIQPGNYTGHLIINTNIFLNIDNHIVIKNRKPEFEKFNFLIKTSGKFPIENYIGMPEDVRKEKIMKWKEIATKWIVNIDEIPMRNKYKGRNKIEFIYKLARAFFKSELVFFKKIQVFQSYDAKTKKPLNKYFIYMLVDDKPSLRDRNMKKCENNVEADSFGRSKIIREESEESDEYFIYIRLLQIVIHSNTSGDILNDIKLTFDDYLVHAIDINGKEMKDVYFTFEPVELSTYNINGKPIPKATIVVDGQGFPEQDDSDDEMIEYLFAN